MDILVFATIYGSCGIVYGSRNELPLVLAGVSVVLMM